MQQQEIEQQAKIAEIMEKINGPMAGRGSSLLNANFAFGGGRNRGSRLGNGGSRKERMSKMDSRKSFLRKANTKKYGSNGLEDNKELYEKYCKTGGSSITLRVPRSLQDKYYSSHQRKSQVRRMYGHSKTQNKTRPDRITNL